MTDIYDRSTWPPPEENPLVLLLRTDAQWFSNEQVVAALDLTPGRALLSSGTIFRKQIRDDDAAIESRGYLIPGNTVNRSNGGALRVFSRRAVVIAGMRTETVNAAAFRDWLADQIVEGLRHG